MRAIPLKIDCPKCGSSDVAYSCEPECCFNHVCGDCLASFELFTVDLGSKLSGVTFELGQRDCLDATVACARCEGLNVALIEGDAERLDSLVCRDCSAGLKLGFDFGD